MPQVTADRAGYIAALPTFAQSAAMIGIHPSGIGRAVKRLGIEPVRWGNRDKHLSVADLMRLAQDANRESEPTVALRLLEHVAREHPDHVCAIRADVDACYGHAGAEIAEQPADSPRSPASDSDQRHAEAAVAEMLAVPVLRAPMEPETARRLVTLYTLPSIHQDL